MVAFPTVTGLTGTGALARQFQLIRKSLGQTGQSGELSDSDLLNYIRAGWAEVLREINSVGDNKIRVRYDVAVVAEQAEYALPPTIEQFLSFEKWTDGTPPLLEWEIVPRHPLNAYGPGFTIEGPMMRLDPTWRKGHTMRLTYVPNGDVYPHESSTDGGTFIATDDGADVTAVTSMTLDSTPVDSVPFDTRENAYAGYVLRILDATGDWGEAGAVTLGVVQERVITASDINAAGTGIDVDFAPSLDPLPGWTGTALDDSGTCTYEVLPMHWNLCETAVALWVIRFASDVVIGDTDKAQAASRQFQTVLRGLRLKVGQMQARTGKKMHRSIRRS